MIQKKISTSEDLPFFAKEEYLNSKSSDYGWFEDNNQILPYIIHKELFFKRLVFTTEVIKLKNKTLEEEKEFLNDVIKYIKKNKICDFVYKPQPSAVFNTYPDNCDCFKWGTYQIDIENDFEQMLKKVKKNQRNYLRKAIKEGVKIEQTSNIDEVYELANNTLTRQKIPLGICKKEFKKQFELLHPNNMLMFKATYKSKIQGVLVIFIDKQTAYAEYAGSIKKPKNGSLKLLHLMAMHHLAENYNIKNYDFIGAIPDIKDGSKEAGIQKFKKEFGADIKEGYQFRLVLKPMKYFLFNLCLKMSFRLKGVKYVDPVERYKRLSKSRLKV